jgi:hypothetical protein
MPYLLSLGGLRMVREYVKNWYSVAAVFLRLLPSTTVKFRNGDRVFLSRDAFHGFHEALFQTYLKNHGFRYSTLDGRVLVITNTGIKIMLPTDYSNVIDEIYLRREYGELSLHGREVIDVGASIADSSLYFASLGAKKVYAFETDPVRLEIAKKNITINNMSSTIELLGRKAASEEISVIVEANSLDNVFMKIDCEGCEYEIIDNLSDLIYKKIDNIVLEYHNGAGGLIRKLKSVGYDVRHKKLLFIREGKIYARK